MKTVCECVNCSQPERQKRNDRITASMDDVTSMKISITWPLSTRSIDDDNNAVDNERKPLSCIQDNMRIGIIKSMSVINTCKNRNQSPALIFKYHLPLLIYRQECRFHLIETRDVKFNKLHSDQSRQNFQKKLVLKKWYTFKSPNKWESISQSEKQQLEELIKLEVVLYDNNPSV